MRASRKITAIASMLLMLSLWGSIFVLRKLDQVRTGATLEEVLYISSPKALQRMSLGYNGLLADVYWTRAVQYFGGKHHVGAHQYKLLAPLLEITTTLDPRLLVAYQYGGSFLAPKPPGGAGMPQAAIDLTNYGIAHNPDDWHLYYQLGFIYYMELNDLQKAADAFSRGSRVPHAHPFLRIMAGLVAERAGDINTARLMWTMTYENTAEKSIKANASAHLRALQVDQDVTALESAVAIYKQRNGRFPNSFADLAASGMLRGTPRDPRGNLYKLSSDGRVELQSPDDFPFVRKGTPPGYVPPVAPKFLPTD